MPPKQPLPRPGFSQRRRALVACVVTLFVWGFRWVWPLQLIPGWVVVVLVVWALVELIRLLLWPQRWR